MLRSSKYGFVPQGSTVPPFGGGGEFASQAEAEAGTDTTKYMNPLRTAEAIAALGGGGGALHEYDVAGLPDPSDHEGEMVYVSDGNSGGPCLGFSPPGLATWKRIVWGSTVSATTEEPDNPPIALGLEMWLEAAFESSFILSGEDIVTWLDRSGNSRHMSQGTSGSRPLRSNSLNLLNSLSTVKFDGTDDFLQFTGTYNFTEELSIYMVIGDKGTASINYLLDRAPNADEAGRFGLAYASSNLNLTLAHDSFGVVSPILTYSGIPEPFLFSAIMDNGAAEYFNDGTSITTHSGLDSFTHGNSYPLTLGRSGDYNGYYFNGSFAEILIYSAVHDETDRESIESYLRAKWGI